MARYDDRNWITVIGHADGAKSVRVPDTARNVRIRASFPVGDREQSGPAGELKRGSTEIERKGERTALACEVFVEFADIRPEFRPRLFPLILRFLGRENASVKFEKD